MAKNNYFTMTVGDISMYTYFCDEITQKDIDDWEELIEAFEKFLSRCKKK